MNDERELLELAALAAGIDLDWDVPPKSPPWRMTGEGDDRGPASQWNPLSDSGDALDLAVRLSINIKNADDYVTASVTDGPFAHEHFYERSSNNADATRRAIVRVAAEIGRAMKAAMPPPTDAERKDALLRKALKALEEWRDQNCNNTDEYLIAAIRAEAQTPQEPQ